MTIKSGLLSPEQAAEWLGVSRRTIYNLPIRYVKIGRLRKYDLADLQAYADLNGNREHTLKRPA